MIHVDQVHVDRSIFAALFSLRGHTYVASYVRRVVISSVVVIIASSQFEQARGIRPSDQVMDTTMVNNKRGP